MNFIVKYVGSFSGIDERRALGILPRVFSKDALIRIETLLFPPNKFERNLPNQLLGFCGQSVYCCSGWHYAIQIIINYVTGATIWICKDTYLGTSPYYNTKDLGHFYYMYSGGRINYKTHIIKVMYTEYIIYELYSQDNNIDFNLYSPASALLNAYKNKVVLCKKNVI